MPLWLTLATWTGRFLGRSASKAAISRPCLISDVGNKGMESTDRTESRDSRNSRQALLPMDLKAPWGKKASLLLQALDEQDDQ